jgi:hypothetical protein
MYAERKPSQVRIRNTRRYHRRRALCVRPIVKGKCKKFHSTLEYAVAFRWFVRLENKFCQNVYYDKLRVSSLLENCTLIDRLISSQHGFMRMYEIKNLINQYFYLLYQVKCMRIERF